jgi:alkanesulfonate monooxygenase SsuD/methylene tetrahydromethanopterin reductase-like flavin-dependent oxidoreductase (luciferase family)
LAWSHVLPAGKGAIMRNGHLRFGVYIVQDAPLDVLRRRWREAEELGFDDIWLADHTRDFRSSSGYWLDAWIVLGIMAVETTRVRIGTLVSNPILRPPAVLARLAATVDNLSGGRLELGIGTGIAGFDHDATGTPYWPIAERLARFAEYVTIVDELLCRAPGPVSYEGTFHRSVGLGLEPPPVQRPRPPLTVGGQSPAVLRVAAERADCWNTHGPFGRSVEEILDLTRRQNGRLDELCRSVGRDPAGLRRALLLYDALHAWSTPGAFETTVSAFSEAGISEFVVFWPEEDRRGLFERAALESMPAFRTQV